MLKMREVAKTFYRKEVENSRHISYWYDKWSTKGVLFDILGDRGIIDMGIKREATVEEAVISARRRKRHRTLELNEIEEELLAVKEKMRSNAEDVALWKRKSDFKPTFSTQETWMLIRDTKSTCNWEKGIWFSQASPKFSFITWLAKLDRLSTMDRVSRWSQDIDETCVLCKNAVETRNHLFYECSYSGQVWEYLVRGILRSEFTNIWSEIVELISTGRREKNSLFCIRYAFQASVQALWRERNKIRHGDKPLPLLCLKKFVDKEVRNKLSLLRTKGVKRREGVLQFWFATRV